MGQAKVRKSNGTYFGQEGYVPRTTHDKARFDFSGLDNPNSDDYAVPCPCESERDFRKCCGGIVVARKEDDGSLQNPVSTARFVYTKSELQEIRFDPQFAPAQWADSCDSCGGVCEWINIPNKVWKALGLDKEFLCVKCMSRLIDTSLSGTVEDLAQAILSRKAKFGLQYPIEFFEVALSDKYGVIQMFSVDLPPMSKKEFVNHVLTPRKEVVIHPVPQVCADGIHPWGRLQRRSMIEPLNWPVYVFTVANSIWYIESQIRNQFEQYCDKEGLTPTSAKQMTEGAPDAAVRPFVFDATQQAAV